MLHSSLVSAVEQLVVILQTLKQHDKGASVYVGAHVGRHIRHASDHLQALLDFGQKQRIDYNFRTRDSEAEKDLDVALAQLRRQTEALTFIGVNELHAPLMIVSEMSFSGSVSSSFQSTLAREMLYLINHTIHHAAYIKLVLKHESIELPAEIGLAPCTLSFMKSQACAALAS